VKEPREVGRRSKLEMDLKRGDSPVSLVSALH
jgi:hypothetical protein